MGDDLLIQITPQLRILVAIEAIDGRKGIDSLAQLCREKLGPIRFPDAFLSSVAGAQSRSAFWLMTVRDSGWRLTNRLHTTPLSFLAQHIGRQPANLLPDPPIDPIDCNVSPACWTPEARRVAIRGRCKGGH